ncbi:hypothetical protein HK405_006388 [Cladochytrium tenue]|nr:hypothetical protein HK405_006388 [Cladochytrium tenue]
MPLTPSAPPASTSAPMPSPAATRTSSLTSAAAPRATTYPISVSGSRPPRADSPSLHVSTSPAPPSNASGASGSAAHPRLTALGARQQHQAYSSTSPAQSAAATRDQSASVRPQSFTSIVSSPSPIDAGIVEALERLDRSGRLSADLEESLTPTTIINVLAGRGAPSLPFSPPPPPELTRAAALTASRISPPSSSAATEPLPVHSAAKSVPTTRRLKSAFMQTPTAPPTPPTLAPSIHHLSSSPEDPVHHLPALPSVARTSSASSSWARGPGPGGAIPSERQHSTHLLASTSVRLRRFAKTIRVVLQWEEPPRTVMLVTKLHDPDLVRMTRDLADWLVDSGLIVFVEERLRDDPEFQPLLPPPASAAFTEPLSDPEDAEDVDGRGYETPTSVYMTPISVSTYRTPLTAGPRVDFEDVPDADEAGTTSDEATLSRATTLSGGRDGSSGKLQYWSPEGLQALVSKLSLQKDAAPAFDIIVTLGGDGTVLFTASLFNGVPVPPIVPFDLGSLGFLAVFDFKDARDILHKILIGGPQAGLAAQSQLAATSSDVVLPTGANSGGDAPRFAVNTRMRLACTIWRRVEVRRGAAAPTDCAQFEGEWVRRGETFHVLNELLVDRGPSPYMSQLELFVDGAHLTTMQADGLVVATPTGSTAYSLSANGSMVHPAVPTILVTPICPHTLSFRPMLLPDSAEFRVLLPAQGTRSSSVWASFDGKSRTELVCGDFVSVTMSKFPVPTVCADDPSKDWMESLRRCLNFNVRTRQKAFQ